MKVMFLNALQEGGAAAAAMRLLKGVREKGADSRMIVQGRATGDPSVIGARSTFEEAMAFARPRLEWLFVMLRALKKGCVFSPALIPDRLGTKVARFSPELIHLHWITNSFVTPETLRVFNRPLIWTLHDSWAFTGGCHVPGDCRRYRQRCGGCPVISSSRENDISRRLWGRKRKAWNGLNLSIVAPSRWMAESAKASSLFHDLRIEVIPNCLELERYRPVDKHIARERLSLAKDKRLILFGGKNCMEDPNKGFPLLERALRKLAGRQLRNRSELIVVGSPAVAKRPDPGMNVRYLGWLNDEEKIALVNAAADVCVVPSVLESLSYAAMEAMACGTPCVAFDQGGVPDVIEHKRTGYLARPYDPDDLADGIEWIFESESRTRSLSVEARLKAEREFATEKVSERYMNLYREISGAGEA